TSPYAHARIKNIDVSKAEALPGVRATLTYKDTKDVAWKGQLRVLDSKVRYVGDEVAAVAADTEEIADEALKLIEVEYDVLPAVFDPEEALKSGAPLVYEDKDLFPGGNLIDNQVYVHEKGDIEQGFKEADHIYEDVYEAFPQRVAALGRSCAIAWWENDKLTIIDSNQAPFLRQDDLSAWLNIPRSKIKIVHKFMGCGMGEDSFYLFQPIAAYLARKTGRAVKVITSPGYAVCGCARSRAQARIYIKIGVKDNGDITAWSNKIYWNKGSNCTGGPGPVVITATAPSIYYVSCKCPNTRDEVYGTFTNTPPNHAYRGYSSNERTFCIYSLMNRIADDLGIDPVDYWQRIALSEYSTMPENTILLGRAGEAFDWKSKWHKPGEKTLPNGKKHGVGLALVASLGGYGMAESAAMIKLTADGSATLQTGTSDTGMGNRTALTQVAAEALGMEMKYISINAGDTTLPQDLGSYASRVAKAGGMAVYRAAEDLKSKLFPILAVKMEVDAEDLVAKNGKIYSKTNPAKEMTWQQAAEVANAKFGTGCLAGLGSNIPFGTDTSVGFEGAPYPPGSPVDATQSIAGNMFEVEVDTETGEVTILSAHSFYDIGQCLNPGIVNSQITGGTTVGIGYGLTEDLVYDPDTGTTLNANHLDYKLPTILDVPKEGIDILLKEDEPNVCTPYGQRGLGEPPCVPGAGALNAAIYNAIGVSVNANPMTPDKILKALGKA
ncbi:MAG: molybdopterin-dependent oxidoreductase, partial [Dehalococcoidales bacterium]|nr:molybdopterin-dependent oxidoreductase [Dehalococcoidales bacterium]